MHTATAPIFDLIAHPLGSFLTGPFLLTVRGCTSAANSPVRRRQRRPDASQALSSQCLVGRVCRLARCDKPAAFWGTPAVMQNLFEGAAQGLRTSRNVITGSEVPSLGSPGESMSLLNLLLGRRLANEEYVERKISAFEGVPAMGLDLLASSSYGSEAAMTVLMPLGAAGLGYIGMVMPPILLLLAILYVSYRQTIRAYPTNGGAYTVSKVNLGTNASLIAAAALMIDYVLTVAVGISAGVGALTSAVPPLHPYTLTLCLAILVVVTVMNLRGTVDAGRAWALPTYLFVASLVLILAIGTYKTLATGGHPQPVVPPPGLPETTEAVSIWLLLRSFAAGCTAMTGVEAVSNGVSAFREPTVKRAHRTLGAICAILGILLAGITYLVRTYRVAAMDQTQDGYQSVLSQLAGAVIGHGIFYYVAIG